MAKLKYFFALSRTPHGILDLATPAIAALLWQGSFPSFRVVLLGLVTAFAGYTAVYAVNDLVDYRPDKKKLKLGVLSEGAGDLDALVVRHPLARGFLTYKEALWWAMAWSLPALIGAYLLNPFCLLFFPIGCLLEMIYCLLWKTSPFRSLISGTVKTVGGLAAVFAVDPHPSPVFLILLFLWVFFWEIGGQHIPNDWTDMEEDRLVQARTIPVELGTTWANSIIFPSLLLVVALNGVLLELSPLRGEFLALTACLGLGIYLLLWPGYRLIKTGARPQAVLLFNRASYYPMAVLMVISLSLLI
ncbi:MAG: UbiA family prenyltransferase [Deltaproteobacteria bacterium]|nr:UbiA family prenyltransferase [Deltaproteobacteria bacterium]